MASIYLGKDEYDLLINGYIRSLNILSTMIPNEIIVLCLSFYYQGVDIKLIYCDDKTGIINTQQYTLRSFPFVYTLKHIAIDLENEMECNNDDEDEKQDTPYIHIWLKFGQIKAIYPIDKTKAKVTMEELKHEDDQRWVEVPDDYLTKCPIHDIIPDKDNNIIVIERKQDDNTWPRAQSDNWRNILQTGDIIDVRDEQNKWYESLVRLVYPKNSDKAGTCIIHYIGWNIKWDEPIYIDDEERLAKRHRHILEPHRVTRHRIIFNVINGVEKSMLNVVRGRIKHEDNNQSIYVTAYYGTRKLITYTVKLLIPGINDAIGIMSDIDVYKQIKSWINEINGYKYWLQTDGICIQKDMDIINKIIVNREWKANDVITIEVDKVLEYVAFYVNDELLGDTVISIEPNMDYHLFVGIRTRHAQYDAFMTLTKKKNYCSYRFYKNN